MNFREGVVIIAQGMGMGVAEILPGISGGTVAIILGIYERLIGGLSNLTSLLPINRNANQWSDFAQNADLYFLLLLLIGMFTGMSLTVLGIDYLLHTSTSGIAGLIFGLIAGSIVRVARETKARHILFLGIPGAILGIGLSSISINIDNIDLISFPMLLISGIIASCAWLLPGVSGAYLLLLIGVWQPIVHIAASFDTIRLGTFGAGIILGTLMFSKVLRVLIIRYRQWVLAFFVGVLTATAWRTWPFRNIETSVFIGERTGDYETTIVLTAMAIGLALVTCLTSIKTKTNVAL